MKAEPMMTISQQIELLKAQLNDDPILTELGEHLLEEQVLQKLRDRLRLKLAEALPAMDPDSFWAGPIW